jgi:hypothetical protein
VDVHLSGSLKELGLADAIEEPVRPRPFLHRTLQLGEGQLHPAGLRSPSNSARASDAVVSMSVIGPVATITRRGGSSPASIQPRFDFRPIPPTLDTAIDGHLRETGTTWTDWSGVHPDGDGGPPPPA